MTKGFDGWVSLLGTWGLTKWESSWPSSFSSFTRGTEGGWGKKKQKNIASLLATTNTWSNSLLFWLGEREGVCLQTKASLKTAVCNSQWCIYPLTCCLAWSVEKESVNLRGESQALPSMKYSAILAHLSMTLPSFRSTFFLKAGTHRFFNLPSTSPGFQQGQSNIQTALLPAKVFPFTEDQQEWREKNGSDVGVVAPKRPSEQRNNQLHMSHSSTDTMERA